MVASKQTGRKEGFRRECALEPRPTYSLCQRKSPTRERTTPPRNTTAEHHTIKKKKKKKVEVKG